MRNYEIIGEGLLQVIELTESDGTIRYVPINASNSDYQRYLRWLENPDAELDKLS